MKLVNVKYIYILYSFKIFYSTFYWGWITKNELEWSSNQYTKRMSKLLAIYTDRYILYL